MSESSESEIRIYLPRGQSDTIRKLIDLLILKGLISKEEGSEITYRKRPEIAEHIEAGSVGSIPIEGDPQPLEPGSEDIGPGL